MSITNQHGDVLKVFALVRSGRNLPNGETIAPGQTLETGFSHKLHTLRWHLQTPRGALSDFDDDEIEIATEDQDAAAAFACLTNTLRCVLDLEKPMDDEDRARIGRWLLGKLFEGEPGTVRTVRDLKVGELIDLITDAQSHCIVV